MRSCLHGILLTACLLGLTGCPEADTFEPAEKPFTSTGEDGAFAPTEDTVLPSGVYHFTSITIPADVTVTTDGEGTLELLATEEVLIEGRIDLSGGLGGVVALGNPGCLFKNGGGGATGSPIPGTAADSEVCQRSGLGGLGVVGEEGEQQVFFDASSTGCGEGGSRGGGAGGAAVGGGGGGGGFAGGGGGGGRDHPGGDGGYVNEGGGGSAARGGNWAKGFTGVRGGGSGGMDPEVHDLYAGDEGEPGGGGGGAIGIGAFEDLSVSTTFRPGSGGGGGGGQDCPDGGTRGAIAGAAGGGGGGGGALRIASPTRIELGTSGELLARGGKGGQATGVSGNYGGGGGGGSGGVIYLHAPELDLKGVVSAAGGEGGKGEGFGGAGGLGRIRLSVETCKPFATLEPPLGPDGCTPMAEPLPEFVYVGAYPE